MTVENFELIDKRKIFNIDIAKFYRLKDNNLKVILLKNDIAPIVNFQIWYKVGSSYETGDTKTGLAHFLEHMMFRGTEKYPQGVFDKLLDEAGGDGSNAFTGLEYTAYTVSLPKERLELIVELEADRMENLNLTDESIELERGAILNERTLRVDDDPSGYMWEIAVNEVYKGTPYMHDIIGYRKDIETITAEDCKRFYKRYYAPGNATVVVTGDFEEDEVLSLIYEYFSPIENTEILKKRNNLFDIKRESKTIRKSFDVLFDKFLFAYKTVNFRNEDFIKLELLSVMLTDIRGAFLKKEYVDKDILNSISSYTLNTESPSIFTFEGSLKNISHDEFEYDFDNKLLYFINNFTKTDLNYARNKLITDLTVYFSSNYKTSLNFGESFVLTENPFYLYDLIEKIKAVTLEEIKDVFGKYINPENKIAVFLLKRDNEKN